MKKFIYLFLLPALTGLALAALVFAGAAALSGCSPEQQTPDEENTGITLMTWNIHNLFDGNDDGFEYDEFLQSSGWTTEKYLGRLNTICAAIEKISPRPDIIMLQEIESLKILEDIAGELPRGYSYSHFANNPGSAIGLGILSRYPLMEAKAHSITIDGESTPRPVLEARVQFDEGKDFVVFICHWKSKIGGDEATENVRKSSARVILRRIRELLESEPDTAVIIAGDLNENHNEFYRRGAGSICALIPDDPHCAGIANGVQKDFFVISGNRNFVSAYFPKETVMLYSPWFRDLENGSYYYQYNWETIDHFLISKQFFDKSGLEYDNTVIINFEPFANANGIPVSYNNKTGMGLSDHLPLLLTLKLTDSE